MLNIFLLRGEAVVPELRLKLWKIGANNLCLFSAPSTRLKVQLVRSMFARKFNFILEEAPGSAVELNMKLDESPGSELTWNWKNLPDLLWSQHVPTTYLLFFWQVIMEWEREGVGKTESKNNHITLSHVLGKGCVYSDVIISTFPISLNMSLRIISTTILISRVTCLRLVCLLDHRWWLSFLRHGQDFWVHFCVKTA